MYLGGVDIGGTVTKAGLLAESGEVLATVSFPTSEARSPVACVSRATSELLQAARGRGLPWPPLRVGMGVPGVVNAREGLVRFSGALEWKNVPLGRIAANALGCAVSVDTDVNAGALADTQFGEAKDAREVIYLSWGTGIGAALVIDGTPYHSRGNAMGNLGHAPAVIGSSRQCYCGATGCLEVEAGGRAMVEQVKARLLAGESSALSGAEITPQAIARAAEAKDALALETINRAATLLARVLASVVAFLNPEMIVIGGGVSACLNIVGPVFETEMQRRAPSFALEGLKIVRSKFGAEAGLIGASVLALRGEHANNRHV